MKLRLEMDDKVLEYTHRPMRSSRFRALCALSASWMYFGMVAAVAKTCGVPGLIAVGVTTFFTVCVKAFSLD